MCRGLKQNPPVFKHLEAAIKLPHKDKAKGKIVTAFFCVSPHPSPSDTRLQQHFSYTLNTTKCDGYDMLCLPRLNLLPWHLPLTSILLAFDLSQDGKNEPSWISLRR